MPRSSRGCNKHIMHTYKVFFHVGDDLGIKTRVQKGTAEVSDAEMTVHNGSSIIIPLRDITNAKLFRLHGLGSVIQIDHSSGRIFVSVVRFMIGQFAVINFFKTGELHKQIEASMTKPSEV